MDSNIRQITSSDRAECDGDIADYIIGAKVHFYPEISKRKHANAKKVSHL